MGSARWAPYMRAAPTIMRLGLGAVLGSLVVCLCLTDCDWKEKDITVKEGEAVRFLKKYKKVKICLDGKLQYKRIADVEFSFACSGCGWYDKVVCDGETVQDLHRWWFLSTCSNGRMNVISRSWSEVRRDPRFKGP